MTSSILINRNLIALRGLTSMRLEPQLWNMLGEICQREGKSMSALVRQIEANSGYGRTRAVRVFILEYFFLATTETGHAEAGHGPFGSGPEAQKEALAA